MKIGFLPVPVVQEPVVPVSIVRNTTICQKFDWDNTILLPMRKQNKCEFFKPSKFRIHIFSYLLSIQTARRVIHDNYDFWSLGWNIALFRTSFKLKIIIRSHWTNLLTVLPVMTKWEKGRISVIGNGEGSIVLWGLFNSCAFICQLTGSRV